MNFKVADNHARIIKNSLGKKCSRCTGVHDYITKLSDDATCDTPLAFSEKRANKIVHMVARDADDVVRIPDDTIVVLHSSARKLPTEASTTQLAQFDLVEELM